MRLFASVSTPLPCGEPPVVGIRSIRREKQLRLWCDMVLRWHHVKKQYVFAWRDWPLWENAAIGRKLGDDGAAAVVEELVRTGHAEWNDAGKSLVTLMWHSADEIAAKLSNFARKHDMIGSVFTVYELHQGDEVQGTVRTDLICADSWLFGLSFGVTLLRTNI